MGRTIEERYDLNRQDGGVTEADGTSGVMTALWDYQVPVGIQHVLLPEHYFATYIEDSQGTPVEMPDTDQVQIEVRDSVGQSREIIFGPALYVTCKERQDRDKMATLDLKEPLRFERETTSSSWRT